jgi:hypothetical protein
VILSIFAIGSKGDLLDSIKRGINEAEAVYKRTKCINRLIDCEFFLAVLGYKIIEILI